MKLRSIWFWVVAIIAIVLIVVVIGSLGPDGEEEDAAQSERTEQVEPQPEPRSEPEPAAEQQTDPPPSEPQAVSDDEALLARLRLESESDGGVDYERELYMPRGWIDADRDGCDTREEVLIAEAVRIRGVTDRCRPVDAAWQSWFDGRTLDDASDVDIDHLVPLAEAHRSGGWQWSAERRERFANDLEDAVSLTAVSASSNRSKSDRDPGEWTPQRSSWCRYAREWISVKLRWGLSADRMEARALERMLDTCGQDGGSGESPREQLNRPLPIVDAASQPASPTPTRSSSPPVGGAVYGSCDDAEAAGEELIRGSQGGGRGFAAEQVPSARDGDGDGVVCER